MCAKRRSTSLPSAEPQEPWFVRFRAKRTLRVSARQLTVTLTMMSVVALPALGMWLGGKLAWNHDPLSSQRFRPVETSALTVRPKDTALQFHHALNALEFGVARLLATAEAERLVVAREQECERSSCMDSPTARRARLVTRATVLQHGPSSAIVHAETFDGRTALDDETYELSRHEGRWVVLGRRE